ncbi:MAG TPA: hypothetical protein VLV87_03180, partial [Gammaproteobacteria bacterium]|nr:hypothetical protein [Gammaproteobacteria bacterium]
RVYREEKLEFFFSCKTSLDQGKLQIAISKATDALVSRLPNIIDRAAESEDRDLLRGFSRDEEHLFSQVLNPLPPPCDLDSLEEI